MPIELKEGDSYYDNLRRKLTVERIFKKELRFRVSGREGTENTTIGMFKAWVVGEWPPEPLERERNFGIW